MLHACVRRIGLNDDLSFADDAKDSGARRIDMHYIAEEKERR